MPRAASAIIACALASLATACGGGRASGSGSDGPVTPVVIAPASPDAGAVPRVSESKPAQTPAIAEEPRDRDREREQEEEDAMLPPPQAQGGTAPFDRGFVARALSQVNISMCATPNGPRGPGHVSLTFHPSGMVAAVTIDQPPFRGTSVGACIAAQFAQIQIPPFTGAPVRVGKSFSLN
jgi:hypothetical protein